MKMTKKKKAVKLANGGIVITKRVDLLQLNIFQRNFKEKQPGNN